MKTLNIQNAVTSGQIASQYINDIISRGFSPEEIAKNCRLPYVEIFNIFERKTENVTSFLFNKILGFYCAVFYAPELIPCKSRIQRGGRGNVRR